MNQDLACFMTIWLISRWYRLIRVILCFDRYIVVALYTYLYDELGNYRHCFRLSETVSVDINERSEREDGSVCAADIGEI